MQSSRLPGHHKNHLILVDSSMMAPPWGSSTLSVFLPSQHSSPAPCLTVPITFWSEWTPFEQIFLMSFLIGRSMLYCILCIYCILFYSAMIIHLFCFQQFNSALFNSLFLSFLKIDRLNFCLIILVVVRYSDTFLLIRQCKSISP
jgi:hypothetical protein